MAIPSVTKTMAITSAKHAKATYHNINPVVITSRPQKKTGYNIWPCGITSTTLWQHCNNICQVQQCWPKTLAITSAKVHQKKKSIQKIAGHHQHCDAIKCWKCLRLTFSSDLYEAILETGKSLSSTKIKFCFWDLQLTYIRIDRMRNIHAKVNCVCESLASVLEEGGGIFFSVSAFWLVVDGNGFVGCSLVPPIDFYSPTTQPWQLMAVVYHHTLVKPHVTPSTIDCWSKTLYPTYPICTIFTQ